MDPTCFFDGDVAQIKCLESLFGQIVGVVAALAGFIFFIMLLVGGFRYMFSGGDPKKVEGAKGTLTAAILGITLVVGSYVFLRLIEGFTGLKLTTFQIVGF